MYACETLSSPFAYLMEGRAEREDEVMWDGSFFVLFFAFQKCQQFHKKMK